MVKCNIGVRFSFHHSKISGQILLTLDTSNWLKEKEEAEINLRKYSNAVMLYCRNPLTDIVFCLFFCLDTIIVQL